MADNEEIADLSKNDILDNVWFRLRKRTVMSEKRWLHETLTLY